MLATEERPAHLWTKENHPRGGRPKGTPNAVTSDLREAALLAAEGEPGGLVEFFRSMIRTEPVAFLAFLARCLPKEVKVDIAVAHAALCAEAAGFTPDDLAAGRAAAEASKYARESRAMIDTSASVVAPEQPVAADAPEKTP